MSDPAVLTRHRALIEGGLSTALAGSSFLHKVLRYHLGLEDEAGTPQRKTGKLLRPSLALHSAGELGADLEKALPAAVALEMVHNFSLIHDDIQDRDETRRGRAAVWVIHGTAQAINSGDLLQALAVREALRSGAAVAQALVESTAEMIEGQALDLGFEGCPAGVRAYIDMIDRKTGALIRCAFRIGGLLARASGDTLDRLNDLGKYLGRAFQIRDDVLGIWGKEEATGKPAGSDIRRRKTSLPAALGFELARGKDRAILERVYGQEAVTDADVAAATQVLERLEVRDEAEGWLSESLGAAEIALGKAGFSRRGVEEMEELLTYLKRRER